MSNLSKRVEELERKVNGPAFGKASGILSRLATLETICGVGLKPPKVHYGKSVTAPFSATEKCEELEKRIARTERRLYGCVDNPSHGAVSGLGGEKEIGYIGRLVRLERAVFPETAENVTRHATTDYTSLHEMADEASAEYAAGKTEEFPKAGVTIVANESTLGPRPDGVFCTTGALDADPVAITEAPIDALSLALAGLPSIALCGTSGIPDWVVKRLAQPGANTPRGHSRRVYYAYDNDGAGDTAAATTAQLLVFVVGKRLRPKSKDWNADLVNIGINALRENLAAAGVFDRREQWRRGEQ